jgi:uncharacterized membrane protein HdeD (DUF308 family)
MPLTRSDWARISLVLYLRGFLLLGLSAVAVRWPRETLFDAMVTAGGVMGVLGLLELLLAAVTHVGRQTRTLMVVHAALAVTFGVVAITASMAAASTTIQVIAVWLLLHAVVALALASRMPTMPDRRALVTWSVVNLACSFVVVAFPTLPPAELLYLGAAYAAVYAILQIGVALWIRRGLRVAATV